MIDRNLPESLEQQVLEHPMFVEQMNRLLAKIRYDVSTGFSLVVGLTGVGKSTLMRHLQYLLFRWVQDNPNTDYQPPIVLSMHSPERKLFSWRDFYLDSLVTSLQEPNATAKDDLKRMHDSYLVSGEPRRYASKTIADIRQCFIRAINDRRPAALLIDEVQELSKVTSNERAHDNLDVLKSLCDRIRVPVIAFGTSKAYQMLYNNEQTARRADVLHFGRYTGSDEDIAVFRGVLLALESVLHIPLAKDVSGDVVYFYERTAGCVGILMDWMKRAVAIAISDGAYKVGKRHLDTTALGGKQMSALVKRIKETERIHANHGTFSTVSALGEDIKRFPSTSSGDSSSANGNKNPGQRKPVQDASGGLLSEVTQ